MSLFGDMLYVVGVLLQSLAPATSRLMFGTEITRGKCGNVQLIAAGIALPSRRAFEL